MYAICKDNLSLQYKQSVLAPSDFGKRMSEVGPTSESTIFKRIIVQDGQFNV